MTKRQAGSKKSRRSSSDGAKGSGLLPDAADQLIVRCFSWTDFCRHVSALPNTKQQGRAFERLVQLYLLTAPAHVTELKNVWRLEDVPRSRHTLLNLPDPDEGIDLIAETHSGEYRAVQCKYQTLPEATVTRGMLATFCQLTFVYCRGIALGMIAHTSNQPIRKVHLLGKVTELALGTWIELTTDDWAGIHAVVARRYINPTPRTPRPHQEQAIDAARRHFVEQGHTRGRLVMPCGTGKTLVAFWIAKALAGRTVLVAVPSLELLKQTVADWAREWVAHGERPAFTIVCSDQTTGQLQDSFVGQTYELGLPTYTAPHEIAARLDAHRRARHLVFTTYQSSPALAEAARLAEITFDVGILDEAHKTVGATTKTFATLLHDRNVPITRRVFMTATERVFRDRSDDVVSMDDALVYGGRFHLYTFKRAIADGVISDYRILTVTVTKATIAHLISDNRLLTLRSRGEQLDASEANALAAGFALQSAFDTYGITHSISFHRSIRAAQQFRDQQDALGTAITNLHISGALPAGRRTALLAEFAAQPLALLTNARCLTEGVDVPAIDCVLFADPKASTVDIVQATGRALRLAPGKSLGYVLLPLIVPDMRSLEEFAKTTPFKHVVRVLATLSTQDDRIAEEFRAISEGKIPSGRLVEVTGDVLVGLHLDADAFAAAIRTKLWAQVGRANWRPFEQARNFVHSLHVKSVAAWYRYCRSDLKPPDIPDAPDAYYHNEWISWSDWLGSGVVAPQYVRYRPFREARAYVRRLHLRDVAEWRRYVASGGKPADIPSCPANTYGDLFHGFGDWLGTRRRVQDWRPFREARTFAQSCGFLNQAEWYRFAKSRRRPKDIPKAPSFAYAVEWQGWNDWLGTQSRRPIAGWRPFAQARAFVRRQKFRSAGEWRTFAKAGRQPPDIPADPGKVYKESWKGFADWLGSGRRSHVSGWREFHRARAFVHGLRLASLQAWQAFAKTSRRPADIPSHPDKTYSSDWRGWPDWLGVRRR